MIWRKQGKLSVGDLSTGPALKWLFGEMAGGCNCPLHSLDLP